MAPSLILASTSPRRLELLKQIGVTPDQVAAPVCDETSLKNELPYALALRLATQKAQSLTAKFPGAIILGGDTVVACGRRLLPKCETADEVKQCLELLSGRRHRVYGGICVIDAKGKVHARVAESALLFKRLSAEEIAAYVKSGEGQGKAGGYALQGRAAGFIKWMSGSPSNIIGLPLFEAQQLLRNAGYGHA